MFDVAEVETDDAKKKKNTTTRTNNSNIFCHHDDITAQYAMESFTFYQRERQAIVDAEEGNDEVEEDEVEGSTRRNGDVPTTAEAASTFTPCTSSICTTTNEHSKHPPCTDTYVPIVTVQIQYATTSRGGSIVSEQHDTTGIFIWPATYLLCQYLLYEYTSMLRMIIQQNDEKNPNYHYCWNDSHSQPSPPPPPPSSSSSSSSSPLNILELGCGCGMVSTVFMKYHHHQQQQQQQRIPQSSFESSNKIITWFATDMDINALDLTYQNNAIHNQLPCQYRKCTSTTAVSCNNDEEISNLKNTIEMNTVNNNTHTHTHTHKNTSTTIVQKLAWGDDNDTQAIFNTLQQSQPQTQQTPPQLRLSQPHILFDWIVAADIIYPSQTETILNHLFDTIQALLSPHGKVIVSYCNRDPTYQVLLRLIRAATRTNFIITTPLPSETTSSTYNGNNTDINHQENDVDHYMTLHPIYDPILRQHYLPPLLDAQILILQRATTTTTTTTTAQMHNDALGHDTCTIFPGLRTKIQNIQRKKQKLWKQQQQQRQQHQDGDNGSDNDSDDTSITAWDAPPIDFND
jgi:hypothetical protein